MKPFSLSKAVICLAFSLLALSACAGNSDSRTEAAVNKMNTELKQSLGELRTVFQTSPAKTQVGPAMSAGTKWEYKPEMLLYDEPCVKEALTGVQNDVVGAAAKYAYLPRQQLGFVLQAGDSSLSQATIGLISTKYSECSHKVLSEYSNRMGDAGWEMISLEQEHYMVPGYNTLLPSISVDYGYEIMWKRPTK